MSDSARAGLRPGMAAILLPLLFALIPAAAESQVRLQGRVISEVTGEPLPNARVELTNQHGRRISLQYADETGGFLFIVNHTVVRLNASHIGYRAATTPRLFFEHYDYFNVDIRLDPEAVLLAPLEVKARTTAVPRGMLATFEMRRERAIGGYYFTQADIQQRRPGYITDLLATVPGITLVSSGRGARRGVITGRAAGRPTCPAQVFIDGTLMNRDPLFSIDDYLTPNHVYGIEVYRGLSTVPPEFLNPDAVCGVVAIWTRRI